MLCIISLFKRLACKRCGALSTYCLAEIMINNQKQLCPQTIDKLGPEGLTVKISTFSHKSTVTNKLHVGTVTFRNKGAETYKSIGENFKVKNTLIPPTSI